MLHLLAIVFSVGSCERPREIVETDPTEKGIISHGYGRAMGDAAIAASIYPQFVLPAKKPWWRRLFNR
jgi:hypothetical protein